MCGIAGVYEFTKGQTAPQILFNGVEAMLRDLRHRGPDDSGIITQPSLVMGMNRLSIIDIAGGSQPMQEDTGRYSIVFNGEIYNYRELRRELQSRGAIFRTSSDTEAVLLGYAARGPAILESLEGMFAFAIYDSSGHELFIARDRLGKKPLYYFNDGQRLIFSSEVQALIKSGMIRARINAQAYWDYLTFRYIPGEETSIEGVRKLPAGHYMRVTGEGAKISKYWQIPAGSMASASKSPGAEFSRLFEESVKKRLVADVPVGAVISGGIDSCAVLHEAAKTMKISSYHVFFDEADKEYNELESARGIAREFGSEFTAVKITEEAFLDAITGLPGLTDEPLSDLAAVPFKMVCDLAARDVKVVLSGEGSDEVLAGYGSQHIYKRLRLFGLIQKLGLQGAASSVGKSLFPGKAALIDEVRIPVSQWGASTNYNITFQAGQALKAGLCGAAPYLDSSRFIGAAYGAAKNEDPLNQTLRVISGDWLIENVLMKSDKVSMSSSIEVRCPFLDHGLVEFLFALPGRRKVGFFGKSFASKILLRRHLKGKVPDGVLTRKKLGFPVPAYELKAKKCRDYVFDMLSSNNAYYERVFRKDRVLSLFERALQEPGPTRLKHLLWSFAVFEQWHQTRRAYLAD